MHYRSTQWNSTDYNLFLLSNIFKSFSNAQIILFFMRSHIFKSVVYTFNFWLHALIRGILKIKNRAWCTLLQISSKTSCFEMYENISTGKMFTFIHLSIRKKKLYMFRINELHDFTLASCIMEINNRLPWGIFYSIFLFKFIQKYRPNNRNSTAQSCHYAISITNYILTRNRNLNPAFIINPDFCLNPNVGF